ncbi:MAG: 2-hydroxychromene-2-carboxylate isomerase family protein glutathione-dependent [Moraxellaceae bacterium]|nr:2-hydroxychromene-2-carboxylate isomerase family protein glutathione-dependent [Moraxellaceae bacterium]
MSKKVEFFFDVVSPYSYFAALQIGRLENLAPVEWRPFLIGGVFKLSGNTMPAANPAKGQYMFKDLQRLADYLGTPHKFPGTFPANSLTAMRALTAADPAQVPTLALKLFKAYWAEDRNISDPAVLVDLLGEELVAKASDEAVKEKLKAVTEEAATRGAFGAPTFFVGDDMYFGEDRIFLIEHALKKA